MESIYLHAPSSSRLRHCGRRDKYPRDTIFTKLKFSKSRQSGLPVGFASRNNKTHRVSGVTEDAPFAKSVCVVSSELSQDIVTGMLYDVAMVPMARSTGWVVIDLAPRQFKATITETYQPYSKYYIEVAFGNQKIVYNPKCGRLESVRTIEGCIAKLEKRYDIEDLPQVIEDFRRAATCLELKFKEDYGDGKTS